MLLKHFIGIYAGHIKQVFAREDCVHIKLLRLRQPAFYFLDSFCIRIFRWPEKAIVVIEKQADVEREATDIGKIVSKQKSPNEW